MQPVYSKVKAGGLGGLIATILVAVLNGFGIDMGPEVAAAIATVLSFIFAYFKLEKVGI